MALLSANISIFRNQSPLSPTIVHYRQKHRILKHSHPNHRWTNKNGSRQKSSIRSVWERHRSSKEQICYYNVLTDQSQWEKPPNEQLSSLIRNNSIDYKRVGDVYFQSSNNDRDSFRFNRTKIKGTANNRRRRKRRRDTNAIFEKDQRQSDRVELSTPLSPPANEKIPIEFVDPLPTPSNSIDHLSQQINEELSSKAIQSSLYPSESTINAIRQLEYSSSPRIESTTLNDDSDPITRYYRAELIEHLLNWPSTQIERETIRLSNEQIRSTTYRLNALRTDLYSIRLRFQQNRFHLLQYHYILLNHRDLLAKLQSDPILFFRFNETRRLMMFQTESIAC